MPSTKDISQVKKVLELNSNTHHSCVECGIHFNVDIALGEAINHYLEKHQFVLLHVGGMTVADMEGKPWQFTTAMLGHY